MRVLPSSRKEKIEWFEDRLPHWAGDPAAVGLTAPQVASLDALVTKARAAADNAAQARNHARSATTGFHQSTGAMEAEGRALIKTIKAFAEASGDENVYVLARVPPPGPREPLGAPGRPHAITIALDSNGQIQLAWQADNAMTSTGVYFIISRALDGEEGHTILGVSGTKSFTDNSIPLGTARAAYLITPYRGDLAGEPGNQTTVQFGSVEPTESDRLEIAA